MLYFAADSEEKHSFVYLTSTVTFSAPQRMEREYYNDQPELKRLKLLRKQLEDLPKQRQCHRYRWTQTETTFDVEIPMHKPCEDKDLYLVVEKDQMQVAVRTDEAFGAITVGVDVFAALATTLPFALPNHIGARSEAGYRTPCRFPISRDGDAQVCVPR